MKTKKSLDWLAASRGYAMYGVFLGHLLIAYINVGYEPLLVVGRFLEPIFVPFYLLLVGAFFSATPGSLGHRIYFKMLQRLLPAAFYLCLLLPLLLSLKFHGRPFLSEAKQLLVYLLGIPFFSWPTWFLIALFIAELLFQPIQRRLPSTKTKVAAGLLLLALGWLFNDWVNHWGGRLSYLSMAWQLHTLGLFLGLMLLGSAARKSILKLSKVSSTYVFFGFLATLAVLVVAVQANQFEPPPSGHVRERFIGGMVFLSAGIYGKFWPFLLSILAGAASLLLLSRLLPAFKLMQQVGDHALVLLGLNCVFHQVLNRYIAFYFRPEKDAVLWLWGFALLASFASLLLCLPAAKWLQKQVPQLVGKPMLKGPLLPSIYRAKR